MASGPGAAQRELGGEGAAPHHPELQHPDVVYVDKWEDFNPKLNQGKLCLVPFCGDPEWEEKIKELTKAEAQDVEVAGGLKMGAKSLCIPHEEKYHVNCPPKCIISGLPVTKRVLFGRSY